MSMMFATPTAPTSSETAPNPRNSPFSALCASARAVSAADGCETFTSFGASGFAVAASTDCTAATWLVTVRTYTVVGWPSKPRYVSAAAKPTSTDESISGARTADVRIPAT